MNKNIKNILKEKITTINILKKSIITKILKSINQNNNVNNSIKLYTNYTLTKTKGKNTNISKKHIPNQTCKLSQQQTLIAY